MRFIDLSTRVHSSIAQIFQTLEFESSAVDCLINVTPYSSRMGNCNGH